MTSSMMLPLSAELRLNHCGNNGAVTLFLCQRNDIFDPIQSYSI
jgi:hypothetical protein